MQFLSLVIITELIIGLLMAPMPPRPNFKNSSYQAVVLLADDPAPSFPADISSTDSIINTSATEGSRVNSGSFDNTKNETNSPGKPSQDNTNQKQPKPPEQANPEDNFSTPADQSKNTQTKSTPEEQNANNPPKEFSNTESAALTDLGTNTNPENIGQTYVDKGQNEDGQLAQVETPAEAIPLLIDSANDNVNDVGDLIENGDFTSTNFTLQRINEQVDQALAYLGSLDSQKSAPLKKALIKFSEEADSMFRWQQLVVPENLEQDFEISRGQFLNIEQIKWPPI